MRFFPLFAAAGLLAGCMSPVSDDIPSRSACEQSSHALRVHDSKIESARTGAPGHFTVRLPSKGHAPYLCNMEGSQAHCIPAGTVAAAKPENRHVAKLVRERETIYSRARKACRT